MTRPTFDDLVVKAESAGYTVRFIEMKDSGLVMPGRLIYINSLRSPFTQRYALAHELGHISRGHDRRFGHSRERDELQADRFAADLLIDPKDFAVAEVMHDDLGSIATALEVPMDLVRLWLKYQAPTYSQQEV